MSRPPRSRSAIPPLSLRAIAALCALVVAPAAVGAAARQAPAHLTEAGRNFDRRAAPAAGDVPALGPAQARAAAAWRAVFPDLRLERDAVTGATRSVANATGFLTGPRSGADAEAIAVAFVREQLDLLGLAAEDLEGYEVTDSVRSAGTGITHLYLRQRLDGVPVYNGQLHVNLADDGRILSVVNQFVPHLAAALAADAPEIDADAAVAAAAAQLGLVHLPPASAPTPAILPIRPGEARRVWNLQLETADRRHGYDVTVDAADGRVWTRYDWVADAQYRVYPTPVEAPTFTTPPPPADARLLVADPHLALASPFGWHDTDGAAGAEFTTTEGNNVTACLDAVAPLQVCDPGGSPSGGASLVFDFPIDLTSPPSTYPEASVTNLFYWTNVLHDVTYLYGFDTVGGNFQLNTYGGGGVGNDPLNADAQDGSGTNGGSFFTPPDGARPRMQMYVWTLTTPARDGDFDAGVIVHEYGHGISNRLVGGPSNVSCLQNAEQPGEGLSDWWALFFTFDAASPQAVRSIGTYLLGQPPTGQGIRTARYDSDPEPNTNPWTYANVQGSAVPHGVGEKWAQVYWMVHGALVAAHGFDPDLYGYTGTAGDAGNVRAMAYIVEGLKNTPCGPGFVDVRDGILAAAAAAYGGADVCTLWATFAGYGLGFSASQGSPNSINDQVPASDLPPSCEAATHLLTVTVSGGGAVTSDPPGIACPGDCTEELVDGTDVELTAGPAPDHYFVGWTGDCAGTGACSVTMDQARTVGAVFDSMPFVDGFETGDASRWSLVVP